MWFGPTAHIFTVTYECLDYIFCECVSKPELRGFFTTDYKIRNQIL